MAAPISREDWARLRTQTHAAFPEALQGSSLPDVLLPYQQQLLHATATHRVVVVEKSRRTGYTWGVASDAVLTSASSRQAGGMDTLYIGYNLDMAREFVDVCAMWAKAFNQAAIAAEEYIFKDQTKDGEKNIQAFRITFASGYEICALSSRPRSLRGRQGYVIIDEAAFHDDLAELLKAALALLMWGGKVLVISTHDGDTNPFNELVEDVKKGRKPYALITLDFDQALKDGLYQRICLVTGATWSPEAEAAWREEIIAFYGDAADEELFVIPANGSGTYLPSLLIERAQKPGIPVVRWECSADFIKLTDRTREAEALAFCRNEMDPLLDQLDKDLKSYFGLDFAMSGDLSVFWPIQIQQDMTRRPPFILELRNVPYAQQRQIIWYIVDRLPNFQIGAMDATGNGAPLAQETATRYGVGNIREVKINEAWYRDITPKFKAGFEDELIAMPRDLDVYNDHRLIKIVRGVPQIDRAPQVHGRGEDAGKGGKKKRHGDSAIANMMSYYATILSRNDSIIEFYRRQVEALKSAQESS